MQKTIKNTFFILLFLIIASNIHAEPPSKYFIPLITGEADICILGKVNKIEVVPAKPDEKGNLLHVQQFEINVEKIFKGKNIKEDDEIILIYKKSYDKNIFRLESTRTDNMLYESMIFLIKATEDFNTYILVKEIDKAPLFPDQLMKLKRMLEERLILFVSTMDIIMADIDNINEKDQLNLIDLKGTVLGNPKKNPDMWKKWWKDQRPKYSPILK